jgi:hypothetical protein
MKSRPRNNLAGGYLLDEALIYIGALLVLMTVGYIALYHCLDNSVALRRSADDIARAMQAGERWRGDVRLADRAVRLETDAQTRTLVLQGKRQRVAYRYADGVVYRRVEDGPWVRFLERVKVSEMQADHRGAITAWRWELELQPRTTASVKPGRIRPLFTFLAVPPNSATP